MRVSGGDDEQLHLRPWRSAPTSPTPTPPTNPLPPPNRIVYRYSRTPVAPPTGFDTNSVALSGRVPVAELNLEHIQGFKGDGDNCNLYSVR